MDNPAWAKLYDELTRGSHVVHVDAGYYSAVLAESVGATERITAIEIDPQLATRAATGGGRYRTVSTTAPNERSMPSLATQPSRILPSLGLIRLPPRTAAFSYC